MIDTSLCACASSNSRLVHSLARFVLQFMHCPHPTFIFRLVLTFFFACSIISTGLVQFIWCLLMFCVSAPGFAPSLTGGCNGCVFLPFSLVRILNGRRLLFQVLLFLRFCCFCFVRLLLVPFVRLLLVPFACALVLVVR